MGTPQQLHDRSVARGQVPQQTSISPETAQLLGRISATVENNTKTVSDLASSVKSLAGSIADQRVEMQRYWSGLEKANADIMAVRESTQTVLNKLDKAVSSERFDKLEEHVKSLNGVDAKLRQLGIDIRDPHRVDAVRRFIERGIDSHRTRNEVKLRVLQGVALAISMAIGAAAWDGIKSGVINTPAPVQQEIKR